MSNQDQNIDAAVKYLSEVDKMIYKSIKRQKLFWRIVFDNGRQSKLVKYRDARQAMKKFTNVARIDCQYGFFKGVTISRKSK
jgi:hypothetical protein